MKSHADRRQRAAQLGAILLIYATACDTPTQRCDPSQELDFSPIKGMAGTWISSKTGGEFLQIDENGRPYAYGEDSRFGCDIWEYPLVRLDPTSWKSEGGPIRFELLAARIAEGYLRLGYESSGFGFSNLIAISLDEDHLQLIVGNALPEVLTRICDNLCDPKTGLPLDDESSE